MKAQPVMTSCSSVSSGAIFRNSLPSSSANRVPPFQIPVPLSVILVIDWHMKAISLCRFSRNPVEVASPGVSENLEFQSNELRIIVSSSNCQ